MSEHWNYLGYSHSESFFIQGVDVWQRNWLFQNRFAEVVDPNYKETKRFAIYRVDGLNNELIEFAAGEFSYGVWGYFQ